MDYTILIGGAAGQGMETLSAILEKVLKRKGYEVFSNRDYMSRVRGGHNFIQVRFSDVPLYSHSNELDAIIALNAETAQLHAMRLKEQGTILCDQAIELQDSRVIRLPLQETAKEAGNVRTTGSAALGALFGIFSMDLSQVGEVLREMFPEQVAVQNETAMARMHRQSEPRYKAGQPGNAERLLINGNEAIGLGALAANCRFYSAYPMTPSTSIMDYLASKMEKAEILVEQAEDEIAAINMAIGASFAGARAMTGTSGGGFALMVEALGLSGMMEIPLVIAEIQRPGPVTGFPTRTEQGDLRFVISASQGEFPRMVIALRNPEDAFYQTVRAFNLADRYQIPVILLGDQYLADSGRTVQPFDLSRITVERGLAGRELQDSGRMKRYEITPDGVSPRIIPGRVPGCTMLCDSDEHDEFGSITESADIRTQMQDKRLRKLEALSRELQEPEYFGVRKPANLLVGWGSMEGPLKEAVDRLNREEGSWGALVYGDIWPFPLKRLREMTASACRIINVEQNATGQLAALMMETAGIRCTGSILRYDGRPLSAQDIEQRLKGGL